MTPRSFSAILPRILPQFLSARGPIRTRFRASDKPWEQTFTALFVPPRTSAQGYGSVGCDLLGFLAV